MFIPASMDISLSINLSKPDDHPYHPEETIRGTVTLHIPSTYHHHHRWNATHLEIQILGTEDTVVDEPDTLGEIRRRGEHTVCRAAVILASFLGDDLPSAGTHNFPFAAKLPGNIPSSMHCQVKPNDIFSSKCSVGYKVICELHRPSSGGCVAFCCSNDVIAERQFIVTVVSYPPDDGDIVGDGTICTVDTTTVGDATKGNALVPVAMMHTTNNEDSAQLLAQDVFICGVIPRGSVHVALNATKKKLAKGDDVDIDVSFENDTNETNVEWAVVQIRETVTWRAEDRTDYRSVVLCERVLTHDDNRKNVVGRRGDEEDDGGGNRWTVTMTVPRHAQECYEGSLITVKHDVRMVAVTMAACVNRPETLMPIQILPRYADDSAATAGNDTQTAPLNVLEFNSSRNNFGREFGMENYSMSIFTACLG